MVWNYVVSNYVEWNDEEWNMKQRLWFTALMSFVLSILMTCWVTWLNLGAVPDFINYWMKAFSFAWPAAAVISFIFGPGVHRLSVHLATR